VLQHVAACCSVLVWCNVLKCVAVLQCAAVCCGVLRCVAVCCSVFQMDGNEGTMGWLRIVDSLKLHVSFAVYCHFYGSLLQKRPII